MTVAGPEATCAKSLGSDGDTCLAMPWLLCRSGDRAYAGLPTLSGLTNELNWSTLLAVGEVRMVEAGMNPDVIS